MNAHEFCADWIGRNSPPRARILDYGCGDGGMIASLMKHGLDAYGCDVFEVWDESGQTGSILPAARPRIARMTGNAIPYPDNHFDVLMSCSVLEHVEDLAAVAREMARVMKPGGLALHLFPDRSAWHEGHALIPFLHRFPKGQLRVHYAVLMSMLGLGLPLNGKTRYERYRTKCEWLDRWTHYRTLRELHATLGERFNIRHIESERFDAKFGVRPMPAALKRLIMRKVGGNVMVLQKHQFGMSTPV